jgi:hypothetical protein
MQAKLDNPDAKARYAQRKQTVEPVFGIIKSVLGFTRFGLPRCPRRGRALQDPRGADR